jgi:trehalose synthase
MLSDSAQIPTTEHPLADGTVYSSGRGYRPFSVPPIEAYARTVGAEKMERLLSQAEKLKGLKLLEMNATAVGGGVAEMLHSSIPFLESLGIDVEWRVVRGGREYYEVTKKLHNMLQGMQGSFTPEMESTYFSTLEASCRLSPIGPGVDVLISHDPQPLGLPCFLDRTHTVWLWRCHLDIEEEALRENLRVWRFITEWIQRYDAAIFSAAHYVVSQWPLPKFIIPPFIDPLSDKNRELSDVEIQKVLDKYQIDSRVPMITQIGRFDPWKGLYRTINTFRLVRRERKCQLIVAGGIAADDPEGERILEDIYRLSRDEEDIHILLLSLDDRKENYLEVNALQRAASVIMQPSTREGFGLVVTEALWKRKPIIAADVGAIPLQVADGYTGFFYDTPQRTARRIVALLERPKVGMRMGERGRMYVEEHFLMPDRLADHLAAIDMTMKLARSNKIPRESIVSFHPWTKLVKRKSRLLPSCEEEQGQASP